MSRSAPRSAVVALALLLLASCAATPPSLTASDECVSWIDFESAQDVYDNAEVVVIATATPTASRRSLFGVDLVVYEVRPEGVLKGELDATDVIEVLSTPLTCERDGSRYPGGVDPLAREDEFLLYLSAVDEGTWRTFSPYDAAETIPVDGTLPFLPGT